jgi:hypothetical protein
MTNYLILEDGTKLGDELALVVRLTQSLHSSYQQANFMVDIHGDGFGFGFL